MRRKNMAEKLSGRKPRHATLVKIGARWEVNYWIFPDGSKGWYGHDGRFRAATQKEATP